MATFPVPQPSDPKVAAAYAAEAAQGGARDTTSQDLLDAYGLYGYGKFVQSAGTMLGNNLSNGLERLLQHLYDPLRGRAIQTLGYIGPEETTVLPRYRDAIPTGMGRLKADLITRLGQGSFANVEDLLGNVPLTRAQKEDTINHLIAKRGGLFFSPGHTNAGGYVGGMEQAVGGPKVFNTNIPISNPFIHNTRDEVATILPKLIGEKGYDRLYGMITDALNNSADLPTLEKEVGKYGVNRKELQSAMSAGERGHWPVRELVVSKLLHKAGYDSAVVPGLETMVFKPTLKDLSKLKEPPPGFASPIKIGEHYLPPIEPFPDHLNTILNDAFGENPFNNFIK